MKTDAEAQLAVRTKTFFSIELGWAFTNTVQSECITDVTPGQPALPTEIDAGFISAQIRNRCCNNASGLMVTAVGHHLMAMVSGARLRSRARKVVDIEEGNANHLFHEVDIDSDGHIT